MAALTPAYRRLLSALTLLPLLAIGCAATTTGQNVTLISTEQASCPTPLDSQTLSQLQISPGPSFDLQPGQARQMKVGITECCVVFTPKQACVVWSIASNPNVSIDAASGQLTVDAAAVHDSQFIITADVENGKRIITSTLHIFTPAGNPLVGTWHEDAELACSSGDEVTPQEPIREVIFKADGSFSVTWHPFEVYHDYWGTYQSDPAAGQLELTVTSGNYIPTDIDGRGTFKIDDQGRLILTDMWLGQPYGKKVTPACGQRFIH
jgi:hypothetical protein